MTEQIMTHELWRTILVPHDFSASANHAAALARDEARRHGGTLLLLHVCDLPLDLGPDTTVVFQPDGDPLTLRHYAVSGAQTHLTDIASRLGRDDVAAEVFVREGKPADEILKFAAEHEVSLIVMGTHGRTGIRHLLAGSVTERVVRSSQVPVLTIRHPD
jgi:nucleotide-binding universal stress UspA family protein